MSIRKTIFISAVSSLLTMAVIFAILAGTSGTLAQRVQENDPNGLLLAAPTAVPDPNLDADRSASQNMDVPEANAAAPQTVYQHVAGSAFIPLYSSTEYTYGTKGCTYFTSGSTFSNYPLIVPPGSKITYLRLYFNDTSAVDGTMYLAQYDDGAAHTYLATVTTTGTSGLGTNTITGLEIVPDYVNYNYVMYWAPGTTGSTLQLCGYRIGYIVPSIFGSALPFISR